MMELYFNKIQMSIREAFLTGKYKNAVAVCGRGTGKSTMLGDYLFSCIDTMPRARGILGGPDKTAISNRILPSIQEHWERIGLVQDEDYVIGKKPKKDWERPFSRVEKYDRVISFWNGCAIDMVSFYNEGSARGPSYQFFAGDEMGWVKRENFAQAVFPAMRGAYYQTAKLQVYPDDSGEVEIPPFGRIESDGLRYYWVIPFRENPFLYSTLITSSQPYTEKGQWLWDYENDPDVFYIEGTAFDNLSVLGADYISRQRKALTEIEFRIEIKNERLRQKEDGFYSKWKDSQHIIEKNPYNSDLPIDLSFDFGKFMGLVMGQEINGMACVVGNEYVTNGSTDDLMEKFYAATAAHTNKKVTLYGDVQGNKRRGLEHNYTTLFEEIESSLKAHDWEYERPYHPYNPPHSEKHMLINKALEEKGDYNLPPIRVWEGCKSLIASIKGAGLLDDFKKDKRTEHPNNPTKDEESTHLSDSFDYWYFPKYGSGMILSNQSSGMAIEMM